MTPEQLNDIIKKHQNWLNGWEGGERADLNGDDLRGAYLQDADLQDANLRGAYLHGAYLQDANLRGAYLRGAYLQDADLSGADLSGADLRGADLQGAYLRGADLQDADLYGADLNGANLQDVIVDKESKFFFPCCPEEGSFIGYKKASGKIVVLEIPADAKRSSATTYKCRCEKAKVLRIENLDGTVSEEQAVVSDYDEKFVYTVGKIVEVEDFDENRWVECGRGIHFFISKEMTKSY